MRLERRPISGGMELWKTWAKSEASKQASLAKEKGKTLCNNQHTPVYYYRLDQQRSRVTVAKTEEATTFESEPSKNRRSNNVRE